MTPQKNAQYISYKIAPWPWIGKSKALEFLELFDNADLRLEKFGTSETRTFPLKKDLTNFINTWDQKRYIILKSQSPWKSLVSVMMYPAGISHIAVYISEAYFEDATRINKFIALVRYMYSWGDFDYSFVAHEDEYENKNAYYLGDQKIIGGGRLDICLPGVYWINLFGQKYSEWFGERKFKSIPAYSRELFENGGQIILTRSRLIPFEDKASVELEKKIKKHLGEKVFFDKDNPNRSTVAPHFTREYPLTK